MATCKDCLHYDVCQYHITEETDMTVNECSHGFKDKSQYAEVKHGEWLINSDGYYPYCSECKTEPKNGVMSKHCPNCGARMDGGEKK